MAASKASPFMLLLTSIVRTEVRLTVGLSEDDLGGRVDRLTAVGHLDRLEVGVDVGGQAGHREEHLDLSPPVSTWSSRPTGASSARDGAVGAGEPDERGGRDRP